MARKQFVFYRSFLNSIQVLSTNKEKFQVLWMLCNYGLDGTVPEMKDVKPSASALFESFKANLDAAHRRSQLALAMNGCVIDTENNDAPQE